MIEIAALILFALFVITVSDQTELANGLSFLIGGGTILAIVGVVASGANAFIQHLLHEASHDEVVGVSIIFGAASLLAALCIYSQYDAARTGATSGEQEIK